MTLSQLLAAIEMVREYVFHFRGSDLLACNYVMKLKRQIIAA